jgi:hypothetical protein
MTVTPHKIEKLKRLQELLQAKAATEAKTAAETPVSPSGSEENGRTEPLSTQGIPESVSGEKPPPERPETLKGMSPAALAVEFADGNMSEEEASWYQQRSTSYRFPQRKPDSWAWML